MTKLKTIIVDDEPLALDILESHIEKVPELELVGRCSNAFEAREVLANEIVDLMFLDIQMPQLTGTDFVKTLSNPPLLIFTTAFPNYALEGFELSATDYLLKPISLDRFIKASNKAIGLYKNQQQGLVTSPAAHSEESSEFIFVKADKKYIKVNYDDILYIEGLKDYVIIRLDAKKIITLQTMKSLEERLPQDIFMRIHRSYIVNKNRIRAVISNDVEILENGQPKHIPIGKSYRDDLLEIIQQNRL